MLDKVKTNDTLERAESEDILDQAEAEAPSRRVALRHRFAPQRLTSRIVLLNLLGLVILVTGILYFNQFRQGLIDARVQSLTTQAHIIAAAVAGSATVDTGTIVIDPDSLEDPTDDTSPDAVQLGNLDFPINPDTVGPVLRRLLANTTIRARIIDPGGNLVVDSRFLYGSSFSMISPAKPPAETAGCASWFLAWERSANASSAVARIAGSGARSVSSTGTRGSGTPWRTGCGRSPETSACTCVEGDTSPHGLPPVSA